MGFFRLSVQIVGDNNVRPVYSQVKCTKGHDLRQTHSRWWKTKDCLKLPRYGNIFVLRPKVQALIILWLNDGRLATFTKSPHVYKLALLQSRHINANLPQIQTRHTFSYTVLWVNIWNNLWYICISGRYQQSIEKLLAFGAYELCIFVVCKDKSVTVRRRCLPLFDGMIVGSAIDRRATPGLRPQCRHRYGLWCRELKFHTCGLSNDEWGGILLCWPIYEYGLVYFKIAQWALWNEPSMIM